jgi:hypothetical protein
MLPSSGLLFASAAIAGVFTSRTKSYRLLLIVGAVLLTAGFASFIHLRENASRVEQILLQVLFAIGAGMIFPARMLAPQAAQEARDETAAAATISFVFNLGQCFGIPIGATTYETVWDRLVNRDVKAGIIPGHLIITSRNAEASAEIFRGYPTAVKLRYRHIMAVSISNIWIVATIIAGIIIVLGFIMKEVPINDAKSATIETTKEMPETEHDDTARLIGP